MLYCSIYNSPIGSLTLAGDERALTGLWFENQKYFAKGINLNKCLRKDSEVIIKVKKWLDNYFEGKVVDRGNFELNPRGTEFQKRIWELMLNIPYGETTTYGLLAKKLPNNNSMTPRAVGNAVSRNPISIIIPCHRVVGSNGKLIGYASGVDKKEFLLNFEKSIGDKNLL